MQYLSSALYVEGKTDYQFLCPLLDRGLSRDIGPNSRRYCRRAQCRSRCVRWLVR